MRIVKPLNMITGAVMDRTRKKIILQLFSAFLAGALAISACFFVILKVKGLTVVSEKEYDELGAVGKKYEKLYKIQSYIENDGLYPGTDDARMEALYKTAAESAGDKYTQYLTTGEYEAFLKNMSGSHVGIGVLLTMDSGGHVIIQDVLPGSPAQAADLRKGDRIVRINGKTVKTTEEASERLSGEEGTEVELTVMRSSKAVNASMDLVRIEEKAVYSQNLPGGITYIRILAFTEDSADKFRTELQTAEGSDAAGVIIDLRGNGGGYTDQAVETADQLLPEGLITYTVDRDGKRKNYNSDENCTRLPFVILTDRKTASASELVAAAVKDTGAGKVIGQRTFGKGTIQEERKFSDGSALHVTTERFYSPRGNIIEGKGVLPDIAVKGVTAGEDPALSRALSLFKEN